MLKFRDMPYVRPDMSEVRACYERVTNEIQRAASYEEARAAFFALQDAETESGTMMSLAHTRNTIDTADPYYEGEVKYLQAEFARMMPLQKAYREAMASSPYRADFEKEFGPQLFKMIDAGIKTGSPLIIEETIRSGELTQAYQKTTALANTQFRGEKCNFYGLLKHMESTDRAERCEAFKAWAALYAQIAPTLDQQYDELVQLRAKMAEKLGFKSFTDMAYLQRRRFDYTQEDVKAFREQVKQIITPAVDRLRRAQQKRLGVEKLKYYDEALIFPEGNADPIGTKDELIAKAQKMYREMSQETGEFFDFMTEYELFDLETRPTKRMGGYCTSFAKYKAPFIFSNFNGTSADVDVLTHEAGHAFQGYLGMRSIPVSMLKGSTSEINEIHSMAMEHFAYPWMESFFGENNDKYLYSHLLGALAVIPYMCCVDEFQHRVYENPQMTAMDRRAVWHEIEKAYMPWRDYDGEEFLEEGGFWMQKQHIFLYPFYYIDYALAQMGAFELYGRMKEDKDAAWQDYLRLCRAGGTKGYFDLLKVANLSNPFHAGSVEKAVGHVIEELEKAAF
ncbi:MAG: M3 family oligoendopeptidase [Clostridia bacterium]|nr:M3 family oligoendopeptidase [Clostridia bacterium]